MYEQLIREILLLNEGEKLFFLNEIAIISSDNGMNMAYSIESPGYTKVIEN